MATPVNETILTTIVTRLEAITTTNGYEFTNTGVKRVTREGGFTPKNFLIVVELGDETEDLALSHIGNPPAIAWIMPVNIHVILKPSDSDTTAVDTWRNKASADVRKAVTNATPWQTFGGNAINANFDEIRPYADPDGMSNGVTIPLKVTYRVSETDPYTARA